MAVSRNRRELAQFLRSRRARLVPEDVGLPFGPRRRTPGLRREEIAVLAGLSPTWYIYLEQGRDIRPSPEVLDSLARVLRLDEDERRYLHLLAYGQPPRPQSGGPEVLAHGALQEVVRTIGEQPQPVVAVNAYADVLAWNRAAADWYVDFDQLPARDRNLLFWVFTAAEARERMLDWEPEARDMLARFRLAAARRPGDSRWSELATTLRRSSREFRDWWSEHEVREEHSSVRRMRMADGSVCAVRLVVLGMVDGFHSVLVHVPIAAEAARLSRPGVLPAS